MDGTMRKRLEEMIRKMLDRMLADLMGETESQATLRQAQDTAAGSPAFSNPLDDLARMRERLEKPVPVAIWFIDRPREYYRIRSMLLNAGAEERKLPAEEDQFVVIPEGLPLRNWTAREIEARCRELAEVDGRPEEEIARSFPFRQPGVWVQMSDGKHIQFLFVRNGFEGAWIDQALRKFGRN
jgi:hypothetical protein